MAKAPISRLLRASWDTVGNIVEQVADRLDHHRLDALVAISVDEISYRRGQRYLTTVDHLTGGIVWCAPGRNAATLQQFFDLLGDRKDSIRAVSIDMSGGYQQAIAASIPHAEVCFDPFHIVRLGPTRGRPDSPRPVERPRSRKSSGCSTTSRTPTSHPSTSTPGSAGLPAPGSNRSSSSPAPSAATKRGSSPRSASDSTTGASKASTAASA
jgi:hypothetical protein